MAIDVDVIWVKSEPEYFCGGDSTLICFLPVGHDDAFTHRAAVEHLFIEAFT
jgi:hypothetical protein